MGEIKNMVLQLLHSLCYIHSNKVCIDRKVRISQFCEHDLVGLLSNSNVTITVGEIKNMMLQLLHGLCYVHSNKVCIDSKVRISEFCEHGLAGLLLNGNVTITVGEIKNMVLQLLHGLCYIHSNKVCTDSKVLSLALYM
jgi:serine/threonine protein kinase